MSLPSRPPGPASRAPRTEEPFRLSVRTSMLSEYRDAGGRLGAFELSPRFTSVGALRTALAQLPDIHFETSQGSLWSSARSRFTFKERPYEISIPFTDIRIAAIEEGVVYPETEELLRLVSDTLLPKWQHRARSRFFKT